MSIRIIRLGSPREKGEGLRVGTVRRPPRGVPKSDYATRDFYDVWLPNLSPSPELMKQGQASQDEASWSAFKKKFRAEMKGPDASKILDLLAALSHQTNMSLGCYCEDERRCHRSVSERSAYRTWGSSALVHERISPPWWRFHQTSKQEKCPLFPLFYQIVPHLLHSAAIRRISDNPSYRLYGPVGNPYVEYVQPNQHIRFINLDCDSSILHV